MVKVSAPRTADTGSIPTLAWIFSKLSHTSDLKIGTPVATVPGDWHYRVSSRTGWPGVSTRWLGEIKIWSATPIPVWQHAQLSQQINPWDTLDAAVMLSKQANKQPTKQPTLVICMHHWPPTSASSGCSPNTMDVVFEGRRHRKVDHLHTGHGDSFQSSQSWQRFPFCVWSWNSKFKAHCLNACSIFNQLDS